MFARNWVVIQNLTEILVIVRELAQKIKHKLPDKLPSGHPRPLHINIAARRARAGPGEAWTAYHDIGPGSRAPGAVGRHGGTARAHAPATTMRSC